MPSDCWFLRTEKDLGVGQAIAGIERTKQCVLILRQISISKPWGLALNPKSRENPRERYMLNV